MKVILAEHYGMCFGVRDALKAAETIASRGPITILGEIVHNPVALQRLSNLGAKQGDLADLQSAATSRVMVTAHGAAESHRTAWRESGRQLFDTTCPLVKKAHHQLKVLVDQGYFPVVIGQPGHVEVRGLTGDFPNAHVIEKESDIELLPHAAKYGVISQTTQPTGKVAALVETLRARRPDSEVKFCDTICQPTKDRQGSIEKLCAEAEVIVVVGGRQSNNTRQLVQTARSHGRMAYHVERAEELQPRWFVDVKSVGITAGTSTLEETVKEVRQRIEHFADSEVYGTLEGCAR